MRRGSVFGRSCLSVYNAAIFEILDYRKLIFGVQVLYVFRIFGSSVYVKVIWSSRGQRSKTILLGIAYRVLGRVVCSPADCLSVTGDYSTTHLSVLKSKCLVDNFVSHLLVLFSRD